MQTWWWTWVSGTERSGETDKSGERRINACRGRKWHEGFCSCLANDSWEHEVGWSLLHYLFIASVHSFSVGIKAYKQILSRCSVDRLNAAGLLELVQMTVTGGGGHALKFLSWWVVPPAEWLQCCCDPIWEMRSEQQFHLFKLTVTKLARSSESYILFLTQPSVWYILSGSLYPA